MAFEDDQLWQDGGWSLGDGGRMVHEIFLNSVSPEMCAYTIDILLF